MALLGLLVILGGCTLMNQSGDNGQCLGLLLVFGGIYLMTYVPPSKRE